MKKKEKDRSSQIPMYKPKLNMKTLWRQKWLLLMSVPFIVWLIIFRFIPLWGWTMAFQEVKPATADPFGREKA